MQPKKKILILSQKLLHVARPIGIFFAKLLVTVVACVIVKGGAGWGLHHNKTGWTLVSKGAARLRDRGNRIEAL